MDFLDSQWSIALPTQLHPFIKLVLSTPALQQRLASIFETDAFIADAMMIATEHNLSFDAEILRQVTPYIPMGIGRFGPAPISCSGWPPASWLPTQSVTTGGVPDIDWLWVGNGPLMQPFFEDDIRRVASLPFNRIFRIRTTLETVITGADTEPTLPLKGLIFHMSRCGSTLLAQMFAAAPENCVSSEPEPLDGVIQWIRFSKADPLLADRAIRGIVAALARDRGNKAEGHIIKLSPWGSFALPLMRSAFPDVNWVYLYRDSVEVMVSVMQQPGLHTVPDLLPEIVTRNAGAASTSLEVYAARVLAAMGETVIANWDLGGGLLVAYPDVIDAATGAILAHFGIAQGEENSELMRATSKRDAKMPDQKFASDNARKLLEASPAMIAAAELYMEPVRRRLSELAKSE